MGDENGDTKRISELLKNIYSKIDKNEDNVKRSIRGTYLNGKKKAEEERAIEKRHIKVLFKTMLKFEEMSKDKNNNIFEIKFKNKDAYGLFEELSEELEKLKKENPDYEYYITAGVDHGFGNFTGKVVFLGKYKSYKEDEEIKNSIFYFENYEYQYIKRNDAGPTFDFEQNIPLDLHMGLMKAKNMDDILTLFVDKEPTKIRDVDKTPDTTGGRKGKPMRRRTIKRRGGCPVALKSAEASSYPRPILPTNPDEGLVIQKFRGQDNWEGQEHIPKAGTRHLNHCERFYNIVHGVPEYADCENKDTGAPFEKKDAITKAHRINCTWVTKNMRKYAEIKSEGGRKRRMKRRSTKRAAKKSAKKSRRKGRKSRRKTQKRRR